MEIPHSVVIGVTNSDSPVKCSYNLLAPGAYLNSREFILTWKYLRIKDLKPVGRLS
jgi:hypothetical protein